METAEAVQDTGAPDYTPLKQGVNESSINLCCLGRQQAYSKSEMRPAGFRAEIFFLQI